jgi:hypothetical protein
MKRPSISEARELIAEGGRLNPGPWVDHSLVAADIARAVAERHPTLDPDDAYVLALLHDVGRTGSHPGVPDVRHILDGYRSMTEQGYEDCARVCLTHSFPIKQVEAFAGPWDCPLDEKQFVQSFLNQTEYGAYDRLVQMCDALALPTGPVLMEKRLVDVALRWSFNDLTIPKWRAFLALQRQFSTEIGISIYDLLPDVISNTFSS